MSTLELKGLSKRFGDVVALDGIDLSVEQGEFCVLLGPSGCGKSTLLRIVAGLEEASGGEILLDGKPAGATPRARNIAMVFQSYALYPHKTVRENLAFPLRMRRMPRSDVERRVADAARLLHIEPLLDRRPRALSGGQRQRVAIGRAIVREPALFLFDEPLSNLDAQLRHEMRLEIVRLHRRLGTTVLYVTHDQVEAMTLGRRIAVLRDGRIEQAGTPEEIYTKPETLFVARFVGTPPMNVVEGRIEKGRFLGAGLEVAVDAAHEGPVTLGVRPEHVAVGEGPHRARVEWIEDLGADRYAHLKAEGLDLTARLGVGARVAERDAAAFTLDASRVHLFAGERRIGGSGGG